MTDLIDTTEMYLRTIFELEEEGIIPLRARIAERIGHSGPTVSQTIARMERDGLVAVTGDRHLELSESGRDLATKVMRKHRLAERLLVDVLGLDWEHAHDEACRWEHVISEQVEERILDLVGERLESPYGNPIPGLAEFGAPDAGPFLAPGVVSLEDIATQEPSRVVVRRIGETAQGEPDVLGRLVAAGMLPGREVQVCRRGDALVVITGVGEQPVDDVVAVHVFVERAS